MERKTSQKVFDEFSGLKEFLDRFRDFERGLDHSCSIRQWWRGTRIIKLHASRDRNNVKRWNFTSLKSLKLQDVGQTFCFKIKLGRPNINLRPS